MKKFSAILIPVLLLLSLFPPAGNADQSEDELFFVAEKAYEDGFYDVAMRYIEQFNQKYPDSPKSVQAKLLLGQCYFFKKQYLKAFESFQTLTRYTEFRDATLFWLGETYFKGGDYKQAEKNYDQMINTYPNSSYVPQALYALGWTYFEEADYMNAKNTFSKLVTRFPRHALSEEGLFKMAESSHNAGEHEVAIRIFKDFISQYPKSQRISDAMFYIAESYYGAEDYLSAVPYYAQAAEQTPDPKISLLCQLGLGWSYLKLQKFDLSEKSFESADKIAREKNLSRDDILIGLATLYNIAGDFQKSGESYQKIITQFPQSNRLPEAMLGKANCDYTLANYPDAIVNYKSIIDRFSADPAKAEIVEKSYYGLAWTYLKSGQTDAAIKSFQEIVDKSSSKVDRASALTQIADAYQEVNDLDHAVQIYDQILRDYPDTVYTDYAQYRQGIALLKANKIEAATLSFQGLQANFPKSKYLGEVKYYLSMAYFKKESWEQANRLASDYLNENTQPKNFVAEANYLMGLSNFNLKKYDLALGIFQKMVKLPQTQKNLIPAAELYIAKCLFALDKTKEAVEKFSSLSKNFTGTDAAAEALLWLGDYYLDEGKFGSAIPFYNQFIGSYPGHEKISLAYYELGQSYQGAGRLEEALMAYKNVPETPNKEIFAKAKLAVADIFSRDMDQDTAVRTYESIAVTIPEYKKDALLRIAEIYKNNKNYAKALKTYEEMLLSITGLSKSDAACIQFDIGDVLELLHETSKAVDAYLKVSYLYPEEKDWVIKSYLRLGRLFEDSSQWEQANTIYNKIIIFNSDEAKYAKERIDWIAANIKNNTADSP